MTVGLCLVISERARKGERHEELGHLRSEHETKNLEGRNSQIAMKTARSSEGAATILGQTLVRGNGGELHQIAGGDTPILAQGGPVLDDRDTLKIGECGPTLIEDFHFREKIFHFDNERIPERVVHACGYGAHGYFETYESLTKYTRANIFQRRREKTPPLCGSRPLLPDGSRDRRDL